MQVPESELRLKHFDTGFTDKSFVETLLKDVEKSKKKKDKGEPYKTAKEMCKEYDITMEQLTKVITAEKDAKELDGGKFTLSGNTKVSGSGSVIRGYCRAGELMVKAIEEAYVDLGFRVPITGEYLMATSDEGWAGAH